MLELNLTDGDASSCLLLPLNSDCPQLEWLGIISALHFYTYEFARTNKASIVTIRINKTKKEG